MDAASYEQMRDALILLKILSQSTRNTPVEASSGPLDGPAYEDLIEIPEFVGVDRPAAARKLGRELSKQSKTLDRNSLRPR
jgi:hypothetical protein